MQVERAGINIKIAREELAIANERIRVANLAGDKGAGVTLLDAQTEATNKLKEAEINVILQDNEKYVNDGSLSVHCGVNGIRYINIEAQRGHFDEQLRLIKIVMSIL